MDAKGLIFDYGGTIDSRGVHWSEIIHDGYRDAGLDIDKAEFRVSYVMAERELARTRHIFPHHTFRDLMLIKIGIELGDLSARGIISPEDARRYTSPIAQYCYDAARVTVGESRPVLEKLSERYPIVLVSNFYGNIESVLRDFGIRHLFKGIIESAVVGVRKPDARIFSLGVIVLDMPPEDVVVVGDSLRKDIMPALSIGCKGVWIKGKGWDDTEEAAPVDVPVITSLRELDKILQDGKTGIER